MKYSLLLACSIVFLACSDSPSALNEKFSWLIGTWEQHKDNTIYRETWVRENDSLFHGTSLMFSASDTFFQEEIQLYYSNDKFVYAPAVNNQNEGQAIPFTLISSASGYLFENKKHDFPQYISYQTFGENALLVRVFGKENKKEKSLNFSLKRVH